MTKFAFALLLLVACGKGDSKPAPKPVDEPVVAKQAEPAPIKKIEPTPTKKAEPAKPVADKIPAASAQDLETIGKLDDRMKFTFKPADETFIEMEIKPRIKDGIQAFDVLAAGKVIDTIDSGVAKDDIHMEVKAKIGAMKEGVMAVVLSSKITGKPADYTEGRVYDWNNKAMQPKRKFHREDVYGN